MSDDLILEDLEQDQQDLMEKSDITTLAKYCNDLARIENNISSHERTLKDLKEQADKISSEIIPNLLAEQGLSSLVKEKIQGLTNCYPLQSKKVISPTKNKKLSR